MPIVLSESFLQHLLHWLIKADKHLFLIINTKLTCGFLDTVFPYYREMKSWFPFYIALLAFMVYKYRAKSIAWIISIALLMAISDQISSNFFKNFFERLRPCQDPSMQVYARLLLGRCPTSFSFTSSHAANHFAAAIFFFITLKPILKKWAYLFFVWAGTIAYGQVYVGVHYPLDVLVGAITGLLVGYFFTLVYNKYFGLPLLQKDIA